MIGIVQSTDRPSPLEASPSEIPLDSADDEPELAPGLEDPVVLVGPRVVVLVSEEPVLVPEAGAIVVLPLDASVPAAPVSDAPWS